MNSETLGTSDVTGTLALSTTATTGSAAGNYPITVTVGTLASVHHAFTTFVPGTLTVTNALTQVGASLGQGRLNHTATRLADGRVLVVGGTAGTPALATAELYNPETGASVSVGSLTTARYRHTATVLPSGLVLVTGGGVGDGVTHVSTLTAEVFTPVTGLWGATATLVAARHQHPATLRNNGKVLLVGGTQQPGAGTLSSAEMFLKP